MTRPSSPQVAAACEVVERLGVATSSDVCRELGSPSNIVCNHLARAVYRRMLAVDVRVSPFQYRIKPGWRALAGGEPEDLRIEYVARPRIAPELRGTPWQGLGQIKGVAA